jgi:hypothetical protein
MTEQWINVEFVCERCGDNTCRATLVDFQPPNVCLNCLTEEEKEESYRLHHFMKLNEQRPDVLE